MSFDYAELADVSLELLTEFGADVTRVSTTVGTYDPATGANAVTTADTTRKGALIAFPMQPSGQTMVRGTLIQVGDMRLLVDAEGAIDPQDHFTVASKEYVIVSMDAVSPAGTVVLNDLHIRAG